MAKVIALANQKGGVGKTTSAVNLAYALTQREQRVLAIDMDRQSSLTIYCGHDPRVLEERLQTLYWALMKEALLRDIILTRHTGCRSIEYSADERRSRTGLALG